MTFFNRCYFCCGVLQPDEETTYDAVLDVWFHKNCMRDYYSMIRPTNEITWPWWWSFIVFFIVFLIVFLIETISKLIH